MDSLDMVIRCDSAFLLPEQIRGQVSALYLPDAHLTIVISKLDRENNLS